ncbi:unnamed protein product [Acanthosepion pharaonis]|uniref:Uncharacterized protein n=1 Tax=Acanthosepion pharaonis TaxID=158019 RepID=A0A812E1D1_ACAPH|nr:unnamed protein product [Sepia pharaonis]
MYFFSSLTKFFSLSFLLILNSFKSLSLSLYLSIYLSLSLSLFLSLSLVLPPLTIVLFSPRPTVSPFPPKIIQPSHLNLHLQPANISPIYKRLLPNSMPFCSHCNFYSIFFSLSLSLSLSLSIYLSIYLSVCLSVYRSILCFMIARKLIKADILSNRRRPFTAFLFAFKTTTKINFAILCYTFIQFDE